MVSLQRSCLAVSAVALLGLACGPTKTPDKGNGSTNTPPATKPTSEVTPPPKPEAKLAPIWEKVPSSAFMAMAFHRPIKSAAAMKDALSKMGVFAEFYKEADFDDFQEEFGFDFFDADAAKKFGADDSKGMALILDGKFLIEDHWYQDYSATLEIRKEPAVYMIIPLSDASTFTAWFKTASTKRTSEATFEDETDGAVQYVYAWRPSSAYSYYEATPPAPATPTPTPASAPAKEIFGTIAIKDNTAYFFTSTIRPPATKDAPDYLSTYKKDLKAYVGGLSTNNITAVENFKTVAKKLNPGGDCMMYFDSVLAAAAVESDTSRETKYLTPQNESQKQAQEDQKRYASGDTDWRKRETLYWGQMAGYFPAWGMSAELKKDGAVCEGYTMLGGAAKTVFSSMLSLSTEPPAYGTLFPEDTTFVYRESINFSALKSMIELFVEERDKPDVARGYEEMKTAVLSGSGLDLEKDIIGAFTGHVAFGAPDLSVLMAPFLMGRATSYPEPAVIERAPAPMPMPSPVVIEPSLPQEIAPAAPRLMAPMPPPRPAMEFPAVVAIAQLTSAAAGDKLVEAMLKIAPLTGMQLNTEEFSGVKLYSMNIDGVTLACARVDSYMVFSTNIEKMKQTVSRIQKPGPSFVDKLPTPMSKSLVTEKSVSGCTGNVGGMFGWILKQPGSNIPSSEVGLITKLSTGLGTSTMKISYEDEGISCKGELTLP
jgi:hypothetical protein